jgi:hypothetical protein
LRRTNFIWSQLAILIFVELAKCCGCVVDFGCINDAVVVRIEHCHDGRHGRTLTTGTARTALPVPRFGIMVVVLSDETSG